MNVMCLDNPFIHVVYFVVTCPVFMKCPKNTAQGIIDDVIFNALSLMSSYHQDKPPSCPVVAKPHQINALMSSEVKQRENKKKKSWFLVI